ncbi:transposase [Amorphus sp. 3PC139-8]
MTKPYSNDLRERVVAAVLACEPVRSVAKRFDVAVSSVVKWHRRYRTTGSLAPSRMGARRRFVLDGHRDLILQAIATTPHLSVRRLQALLADHGVTVSHHAVWQFLRREGLSFKKHHVRPGAGPKGHCPPA